MKGRRTPWKARRFEPAGFFYVVMLRRVMLRIGVGRGKDSPPVQAGGLAWSLPRWCRETLGGAVFGESGKMAERRNRIGVIANDVRDRQDADDHRLLRDRQMTNAVFFHEGGRR